MSAAWEAGEHGTSPLANDGLVSGKEYLWYVVDADAGVSVAATEAGQAVVSVPSDGYWRWSYQLVEDGFSVGGPVSVGISVGALALGSVPCLQTATSAASGPVTITGLGGLLLSPVNCTQASQSSALAPVTIADLMLVGASCSQRSSCFSMGPVVVVDAPTGTLPQNRSRARTYSVGVDLPANILGMVPADDPVWEFDAEATLDFTVDWTAWLADCSDAATQGVITAPDMTVVAQGVIGGELVGVFRATQAGRFSAGFKVVTAGGRTDERTIHFEVTQR